MTTITLQEAQAKLHELIHQLVPGEQMLITEGGRALAVLVLAGNAQSTGKRDWWATIEEIEQRQKARGFVGEASEIDRDEQGYDAWMEQILKSTNPRDCSA